MVREVVDLRYAAASHRVRGKGHMASIRDFQPEDVDELVAILKANQQYGHPDTDGPEAMLRVRDCSAAEFLVAEEQGQCVGLIRGAYDGSRAFIYLASVEPSHQRRGIGRALVKEIARRFHDQGAKQLSVIVPGDSEFWKRLGFLQTTRVMQAYPIDNVLGKKGSQSD
jgi:ribosomal protein S18 acetylase RimI-like enzyme